MRILLKLDSLIDTTTNHRRKPLPAGIAMPLTEARTTTREVMIAVHSNYDGTSSGTLINELKKPEVVMRKIILSVILGALMLSSVSVVSAEEPLLNVSPRRHPDIA
jgi:hypothetical protein